MHNLSPPIIGFTVNKPANALNTGVPIPIGSAASYILLLLSR